MGSGVNGIYARRILDDELDELIVALPALVRRHEPSAAGAAEKPRRGPLVNR